MMTRIIRHLREGLRNVIRNGWMSFAAVSAVMVTLAILGFSLILTFNVAQMSTYVTNQLEVDAFLNVNATQQVGEQVASQIRSMPNVKSVEIVSKVQGLEEVKKDLGPSYSSVINGFKTNPLPIKLVIQPKDPRNILQVSSEVATVKNVASVRDPHQYVGPIFKTLDIVRDVGVLFVIALLVTSMFLISNTIRITIFSRRREIEIMKLVGATNWFIRWPFIVEGIVIGVIGALIPLLLLGYGYKSLYSRAGGVFKGLSFPLVPSQQLELKLAVVLLGVGVVIGVWGGVMSVRRFLRI